MPRASGASSKHVTPWLLDRPLARAMTLLLSGRLGFRFLGRRYRARGLDRRHLGGAVAQHLAQNLVGMLAEQRRTFHLGDRVRHLHGIADGQIFAPRRVIDLDHRAGLAQRRLLGDLLHRQDRADRNVELVADIHDLELGLGHGPLLDRGEDVLEPRQARRRLGVVRIGLPFGLADEVADRLPDRRLGDEVDVGVGIGLPALAFEDPARLAAAGVVAGARHGVAERDALAILAVFRERPMREALLVAQLDARQVEHAVLHGGEHLLAAPGAQALVERAHDAEGEMQTGAGVADLRAGDQRRALAEAGRRGRTAGALRHVLVDLAFLIGSRAEALDGGDDHARIELVDVLPGQPHAVERAGREILHQHVALLDQPIEDLPAFRMLGIDGDRALVAVEHGEVEAVGPLHVAQLPARDVAHAGPLDLDHVGAHIGEQLRAGGARLHVREVEDAHAVERLAGRSPGLARRPRQAVGHRLPGRRLLRLQLDDLPGGGLGFRFRLLGFLGCHGRSRRLHIVGLLVPGAYLTRLFLADLALRIEVADPAALAAGRRVEYGIDEGRLAGIQSRIHGALELVRGRRIDADATESLDHLVVTRTLHEHRRRRIRTCGIDVGAAINAVVVEDDDADRQLVPADRLHFHAGEPEGAVAFDREHGFAGLDRGPDRIAHADAHYAPGADVEALARLIHVDDAAREVERVGALVDQNGFRPLLDDGAQHAERAVVIHRRVVVHQPRGHLRHVLFALLADGAGPIGRRSGPFVSHAGEQRRDARG